MIEHIDMSARRGTWCCVCERETDVRQGLAVYEDLLVPDDYEGDHGGMAACWTCFQQWRRGVLRPWDTFGMALRRVDLVIAETVATAAHRLFVARDMPGVPL